MLEQIYLRHWAKIKGRNEEMRTEPLGTFVTDLFDICCATIKQQESYEFKVGFQETGSRCHPKVLISIANILG